jgi:hypothetical protein
MKLKTAIYIIETSYTTLFIAPMVCIGLCFFAFHGIARFFIIGLLLLSMLIASYLKLNLINIYLKKCKYPYEFLSVLRDLGCTDDLNVDWLEAYQFGHENSKLFTRQFLEDNKLATDFGRKSFAVPIALIISAIIIFLLTYASKTYTLKEQSILLTITIIATLFTIYFLLKRKKHQNCPEPILAFNEMGLMVEGTLYLWNNILNWDHKSETSDGNGKMLITYANFENKKQEVNVDLNRVDIDRIDLMILLTHFKSNYTL